MNAQYIIQQGTVGVSRPEGKLPGVPFLTLEAPSHNVNSLTNKLEIHNIALHTPSLISLIDFINFKILTCLKSFLSFRFKVCK